MSGTGSLTDPGQPPSTAVAPTGAGAPTQDSVFPVVPVQVTRTAGNVSATNLSPEDLQKFLHGEAPPQAGETPQAGSAPLPPPGDDKVKHDFLAGRALAQAGNPWSNLDALIATVKPGQTSAPIPGTPTTPTGSPQTPAGAQAAGNSTNDDLPMGRKLINAASAAGTSPEGDETKTPDETGSELDLSSLVHPTVNAAEDVFKGAVESPQAILRGVVGGVEQLGRSVATVDDAINGVLPYWLTARFPPASEAEAGEPDMLRQGVDYITQAAAEDKSEVPEPQSVTGQLTEKVAQFGTGMRAGVPAAQMLGLTGKAAGVFADVFAGATSMNPADPRMSNLIDSVAPNFITDWLKAKPGDENSLFARLKTGLEFAGLGQLFEGMKSGLTAIKQAAAPKTGAFGPESAMSRATPPGEIQTGTIQRPAPPEGPAARGVLPPEWGVREQPLVQINPKISGMAQTVLEQQQGMERMPPDQPGAPTSLSPDQISDYISGRTEDNPIRLNLLRIGSGDDIRNALEEVARTIPEPEVVSNESTIRAADASGLSVSDFLAGYAGKNLDAKETTAMRFMLDSSAQQLIDYAKAASDPLTNNDEARATFLRAFATHRALQQYFVNARAEAGRTLQSWSILSQTRADYSKAVQKIIEQAGSDNVDQMAADLASLDDPLQVSRLVAASDRGTGRDTFLKVFYNALLSNPRTVVKKLASDGTMIMWNMATNFAAEVGGSGAVPPGETAALGYGYVSSLKGAFRMAGKGLKAGESQFFSQFQTMDWLDKSRLSLMANGAPEVIPDGGAAQAGASYLRAALPTSWIGAADDFAKYLNYNAYRHALIYRDGVSRGLEGQDLATHVADMLDNTPESIHQMALSNTLRSTFQEPLTGAFLTMQDFFDKNLNLPVAHTDFQIPVGRMLMPFIKVPANIMRWSYNNTALTKAFPSANFTAEVAAGGAQRDLAMARVWLGSAVALSVADMALNNTITGAGPHDPQLQRAWRAAGNEPYSIQLPGQRSVSYNMVEPLGMLTGAIADSFNIMKFARQDGRENLAASLIFGTGNAILSKTYMQGLANVMEAMNDPDRDGDRVAQAFALSFTSPSGIAAAAHAIDPWMRYHRTLLENEESRLPIVSENLPPARTLWGDPVPQRDAYLPFMPTDSFVPRMLSPWQLGPRSEEVQPIDRWIWENRSYFPRESSNQLGISKPGEFQSFAVSPHISAQVHLSPAQFDRFQQLAGNELKNPSNGLGAKDFLNGLIMNNSSDLDAQAAWDRMSPAIQALKIQTTVNAYRNAAKNQLRSEFPDIEETIRQGAAARAMQLRGQQ